MNSKLLITIIIAVLNGSLDEEDVQFVQEENCAYLKEIAHDGPSSLSGPGQWFELVSPLCL